MEGIIDKGINITYIVLGGLVVIILFILWFTRERKEKD